MNRRLIPIVGLGLVFGCERGTLAPDGGASGGTAGTTGTAATGGTASGGTGGGGTPATCPATCETPAGTVATFATVRDVTAALAGVWQICAGGGSAFIDAPADAVGVEFGPAAPTANASDPTLAGNMYYLVQGGGGLVRGVGFAYQVIYDVIPIGNGAYQLTIQITPNSFFNSSIRYSPCPREFEIDDIDSGGRAILVGGSPGDTGAGGTGGGGAGGGGAGGGSTPPPTCPSTCDMPAGTVYSFATAQGATASLAGLWQICAGGLDAFIGAPADTIGIEFGPPAPVGSAMVYGGNMYYLVQGSAGPVRGAGFDYQLTYDVAETGSFLQIDFHPTPNSGYGGSFRYSPCPREFEIDNTTLDGRAVIVPF